MKQVIQATKPEQRRTCLAFHVVDAAMEEIQRAVDEALRQSIQRWWQFDATGGAVKACRIFTFVRVETPHVRTYFNPCTQDFVQACLCGVEQRILFPGSLGEGGSWTGGDPQIASEIVPAWTAFRADHRACASIGAVSPPVEGPIGGVAR